MMDSVGSMQAAGTPTRCSSHRRWHTFYFHPIGIFQFRYAGDYRSKPADYQSGFEVRRAKFGLDGFVFSRI